VSSSPSVAISDASAGAAASMVATSAARHGRHTRARNSVTGESSGPRDARTTMPPVPAMGRAVAR
jgi:hypothetical protein